MSVNSLPRKSEKARRDLKQAQTALANFQQSTGLANIGEQTKGLIAVNELKTTQATIAQAQANQTQVQVAAAQSRYDSPNKRWTPRLGENKEYQAIRRKYLVETALAARGKYDWQSASAISTATAPGVTYWAQSADCGGGAWC